MSAWQMLEEFLGKKEERLEPKKYKVGVSTGPPSIAKQVGVHPATVTKIISNTIFKGGDTIQVDLDFPSNITPHDAEQLNRIRTQHGLTLGIHASVMYPFDIDSQKRKDYKIVQRDLVDYIKVAASIDAKFIVIHSSYNISPTFNKDVSEYTMGYPLILYIGPDGQPLTAWIKGKSLDWFIRKAMKDPRVQRYAIEEKYGSIENYQKEASGVSEDQRPQLMYDAIKELAEKDVETITGSGINDYDALKVVAWVMYEEKDYLWQTIAEGKSPDKLEDEGNEMMMANAVTARYVKGHMERVKELLEDKKITIVFETPDLRNPQARGLYTMVKPRDNYHMIKAINCEYVRMAIDFEHLASHGYDLVSEMNKCQADLGKYVKVMHLGSYPSPAHTHAPIEKGDTFLYELLYILRKKGMDDAYLLFERGGGRDEEVWKESANNLKQMAMYLEQEITVDQLPPEFHGYGKEELEHERRIVEQHTFDPLQGLLESPSLQHTWLGRELITKKGVRPEEWAKEEYR